MIEPRASAAAEPAATEPAGPELVPDNAPAAEVGGGSADALPVAAWGGGSDDEAAPVQQKPAPAKAGGTKRPLREMQAPNRGWACKTCTFVNPSAAVRCEMECGGERPEGAAPPAGASKSWACKQCTLSNSGDKSHCEACGTWRYHRPLP